MKKIICILLAFSMLLSICLPITAASTPSVSAGNRIPLATLGPYATHGNHQTRTVHTSHGDYAAYVTSSYTDGNGNTVSKWKLFRIDTATGTYKAIFTGEKFDDSSQVSLIVDRDENIWAVTSTSDFLRHYDIEGLDLRAHKYDPKTGEVTSYETINTNGGAYDWYGYGMSFYDSQSNRIVCMHAGGDYKAGSQTGASFNWTYFDIETGRWSRSIRYAKIPARHCYMYGYIDDRGGLVLLAQRDIEVKSLGYPEVGNNTGLSSADLQYMSQNGIKRQAADYAWDQLDLYYFPDIYKSSDVYTYNVAKADYSKVTGTQDERYTLEKRLSNYYPVNQNNNGGDILWVENKNGMTLLHITYNTAYVQAAMDRSKGIESRWYHQVWDMTDPTHAKRLYSSPIILEGGIADDAKDGGGYSFRLYKDTESNMYLVSGHLGKISLYRIVKDKDSYNYTYEKVGSSILASGLDNLVNISSHRGGSHIDNTINVMYAASNKYQFVSLTIDPPANTEQKVTCTEHSYYVSSILSTEPTCTETGENVYRCSLCNDIYTEVVPAIPHSFTEYVFPPTCTSVGYYEGYCGFCGLFEERELPASGHSLVHVTTESTCSTFGKTESHCENCSYTESKTLPKKEHSYEKGVCTECGAVDPYYSESDDYTLGDINADGAINGKDSNQQRQIISGAMMPTEEERLSADVKADGAINGMDANILSQFLAGAIGSLE